MRREVFDVAVIGGGITGAGIALDAASRGLSVALIEKRDFASGASSRSSKLIHGGLRYLAQFHFGLVRESLRERATLAAMAAHLTKPLRFLIPIYDAGERSPLGSNKAKLRVGLWLYDLLAGGRNIARHRWLAADAALKLAPALDPRGLRGAFVYFDGLTDDSRLVIEVIKAAAAHGAVVANYAMANASAKTGDRIAGFGVVDELDGNEFVLRARVLVNATGVWSDETTRLSSPSAPKKVRPSKGIHIVVPSEKFGNQTAVLVPSIGERRFLFVIPWQGRTLIGTTDADYHGSLDQPRAEDDEIDRVVQSVARAFPAARLARTDVISAFAGLRPLIAADGESTKELSRKEEIFVSKEGLITITGGKLTTWRRMAERVVDLAARALEEIDGIDRPRSRSSQTEKLRLAGGSSEQDDPGVMKEAADDFCLSVETVDHLMRTYGGNYRVLLDLTRESEALKQVLMDGSPHLAAEVVYAARHEMAATVEDFLSRRTRIALLMGDDANACAMSVAELMGRELDWPPSKIEKAGRRWCVD